MSKNFMNLHENQDLLRRVQRVEEDQSSWMIKKSLFVEQTKEVIPQDTQPSIRPQPPEPKSIICEYSNSWSGLFKACVAGDFGQVEALLSNECLDVNEQSNGGLTALILASRYGHTEIVELLLVKGAQVDTKESSTGYTALMMASTYGHREIAHLLLNHEAEVNIQDDYEWCSLMMACENGRSKVVELLLESGSEVDMRNRLGESSLMKVCRHADTHIAEMLLDKGADINAQDNGGYSALMLACSHSSTTRLLLDRGADVNMADNDGEPALMWAARRGKAEVVKLLLDNEANVNQRDKIFKRSALMKASFEKSYLETASLLLDNGAEIDMQDKWGRTALMYACMMMHQKEQSSDKLDQGEESVYQQIQNIKILISRGANVNLQDRFGITSLIVACCGTQTDTAELLLKNGAEANIQDNKGEFALFLASRNNNTGMMRLLLGNGAKTNLQTDGGLTPLMIASNCQHIEAVNLLLRSGADLNMLNNAGLTCLMIATTLGSKQLLDLFAEHDGMLLDLQDREGKSALMHAVCDRQTEFIIRLLELGAQVDIQDVNGWSPLMHAVKAGDLGTIHVLVAFGASIHLKNFEGNTIFHICPQELLLLPLFQELYQRFLSEVTDDWIIDSSCPGVLFYGKGMVKQVSHCDSHNIGELQDVGISVSVPEKSLGSPEESVELCICPCFTGPFELSDQYESASPAYLIRHGKTNFQKDITIRIHHYASLQSEEDCEDMAFLTASSTPEYRGSRPVYTFKEIPGAKGVFRPGDQVGEISLRHFCFNKIGKRKRDGKLSMDVEKKHKENQCLYSARL